MTRVAAVFSDYVEINGQMHSMMNTPVRLEILSALTNGDSHGTAPLIWGIVVEHSSSFSGL